MVNDSSNVIISALAYWPKRKHKKNPDKESFGSPLRVIFTTILIFFVSQLVAAFIAELVLALVHAGGNPAGNLSNSAAAQFLYILLAESGAIWLVIKVVKRRGLKLSQIGLGRKPVWADLAKGLMGFVAFFFILAVLNAILSGAFPQLNNEQQDLGFNILNTPLDEVFAALALIILPPLGEETLVRGYLYSGLRSKWRYWPAALMTSLIFGLAHLELGQGVAVVWAAGIDTFVLSLVLVYLREASGALYAGMLVHGLNNLIAFVVHYHALMF